MKHIGIMSMQRIINYGSFLQAYGLKRLIESIGDTRVEFIDFAFEKDITNGVKDEKKTLKQKIISNRTPINFIRKKCFVKNLKNKLIEHLRQIGVDEYNYNTEIDTLVIGSDEVFNCMQAYPVGYSRNLFGKGYEDKNVISYAGSFGHTTYKELCDYHIEKEIGEMLSKFHAVSVRDDNSFRIVKKLTGKEPVIHVDPVLAYDFKKEMETYQTDLKNYIIVYAYTNRLSIEEENYIRSFAKKHGKKIISIGNYSAIADENIVCNPLYVFSYFKNADYVITDTFHGTVFSIKMNTKFCTLVRDSNKNKLYSLLNHLNRTDRIAETLEDIDKLFYQKIDYAGTNQIIINEKNKTIAYLRDNLL